ncbi:MAG: GtrA family protein [Clostridia bacterium]
MKKFIDKFMKYRLFRELFQMLRYGLVGIVNTCITTGIFILLKHLGVEYLVYTIIGYGVGICISFCLNRKFTFKKENENATKQILLFFTVCLSLMGIVELIQYLLIDIWLMKEWLGVGIGMVFYTCTGYVLNRNIVFKSTDKTEADTTNNDKQSF